MPDPAHQGAYAANLVGGLADAGVDMAFISPGSRNTPLTLAFAAEPRIRDISIRDERSAGFAALGYAKATGVPAVVVCTSGSAAAHYLPAIVEANQSATPMIVLTADRPLRLRGTGAPQTMDQANLYGSHVKMFVDLDTSAVSAARDDAVELVSAAVSLPGGVAHANAPFDEPLVPEAPVPPSMPRSIDDESIQPTPVADIAQALNDRAVMLVVGGRGGAALSKVVNSIAATLDAPVFADPQTNLTGPNVLRYGDLVTAAHDEDDNPIALGAHTPDVVLRLGPIPTAKPMWRWLEVSGVDQILIDSTRLADPLGSADRVIDGDPATVLGDLTVEPSSDRSFLDAWLTMDATVAAVVEAVLPELGFPNEPQIAATIAASVPGHSILFVGSSQPIRDLDAFGTARPAVSVIANRGVNGIDGAISTALGAALTGTQTTLYIGDLTALHDISALGEVQRLGAPLRIVVVNNDGGGIFSLLPQARSGWVPEAVYERHWGTPHGLAIAPIARALGLGARTVSTRAELADGLNAPIDVPELIEIATDRRAVLGHHVSLRRAVARALQGFGIGEEHIGS
ncbi:MAG: 2-succinyl-5-enolpyruvyl-6-hydroxy-3-cyclohexene-1-carboxylic-acid synthase [Actinomycetota bacterium]